ncbi:MAG: ATP-grasp domain-containing protein [Rhodocyclaceae bacterium]|nr:ATP-grasp domain-containing protein [Rhodocyclaceae bacterium]
MPLPHRILVLEFISAGGMAADPMPASAHRALLDQGRAMRDALAADLRAIDGVTITCATSPAGESPPLGTLALALAAGEAPAAFLRRVAADHDAVWVVAPEADGILATLCEAAGATPWVGCRLEAIRLTASKTATRCHLRRHGIAVPQEAAEDDVAGRWTVKPDDGAGAIATERFDSLATAQAAAEKRRATGEAVTLERWVDGTPLSLSLLATPSSVEILAVNRQDVSVRADGTVCYHGVHYLRAPSAGADDVLTRLAAQIHAAVPGLAGYIGVDLVVDGAGLATVIEINPRLTCAYIGLSDRLGRPLAAEILAQVTTPTREARTLAPA